MWWESYSLSLQNIKHGSVVCGLITKILDKTEIRDMAQLQVIQEGKHRVLLWATQSPSQ